MALRLNWGQDDNNFQEEEEEPDASSWLKTRKSYANLRADDDLAIAKQRAWSVQEHEPKEEEKRQGRSWSASIVSLYRSFTQEHTVDELEDRSLLGAESVKKEQVSHQEPRPEELEDKLVALKNVLPEGVDGEPEMKRMLKHKSYDLLETSKALLEKHKWIKEQGWSKGLSAGDCLTELEKGYLQKLEYEPVLLFRRRNFIPRSNAEAAMVLSTGDGKSIDGSSRFDDCVKCITYSMMSAVKEMDESSVEGLTVIIDFEGCTRNNFEFPNHTTDREMFRVVTKYFPLTIRKVLLVNVNEMVSGLFDLCLRIMPSSITERIVVIKQHHELIEHLNRDLIPTYLGGKLELSTVGEYVHKLCIKEGVTPKDAPTTNGSSKMSASELELAGSQYSGWNAQEIIDSGKVLLRGRMWYKSKHAQPAASTTITIVSSFFRPVDWNKCFAVLCPEALLLYSSADKKAFPFSVLPLLDMTINGCVSQSSNPRGTFCFSLLSCSQPTCHTVETQLATDTEVERARWLLALETSKAYLQPSMSMKSPPMSS